MTVANVAYDDYLEAVVIGSVQYKNWRVGQTAFNLLASMRPDIAEPVRGSDVDPFYADRIAHGHEKIAVFLAHVRENW